MSRFSTRGLKNGFIENIFIKLGMQGRRSRPRIGRPYHKWCKICFKWGYFTLHNTTFPGSQ